MERTPELVLWSSLWPRQAEALIRFDLAPRDSGTDLCWTLLVDELPDGSAWATTASGSTS